jgi:hypothetical protein
MPKMAFLWAAAFSSLLIGCGGDSTPKPPVQSKAINTPPIAKLTPQQLRGLSMRCEKYVPDQSTRGPYDAKYCEDAIAAWADAPLQMIQIPQVPAPAPQ